MTDKQQRLTLIRSHKTLLPFDYQLAIDFAIELIQEGKESDNILILASCSASMDNSEIRSYVTAMIRELGLTELESQKTMIAQAHYFLFEIVQERSIYANLQALSKLCLDYHFDERITTFYSLYHAWDGLNEIGMNNYYPGVDLRNIEQVSKDEAEKWIKKYII